MIHAFEPHPLTSQVLALNAWASGADVTTHALALSAGDRILALTTAESNLGDTRSRAADSGTMLSPAAPLDEVLPGAVFDLVKIDVQGFETEVIGGMIGMIRRSRGVVIVAEFMPAALRERGLDPVAVLASYGELGLDLTVQVGDDLLIMKHVEIVRTCETAGHDGQVNLVMTPALSATTAPARAPDGRPWMRVARAPAVRVSSGRGRCPDLAPSVSPRIPCHTPKSSTSAAPDLPFGREPRIGILVVAYNAASTLAKTLDRIPAEFRSRISEVFVCDDASPDHTYLVGLGYQDTPDRPADHA